MPERIRGGIEFALFLTTLGVMIYGVDSFYDSQNNLSIAKNTKDSPPANAEKCDLSNPLNMACWYQTESELCDGQNTIFDRTDDVCETIKYWNYKPAINYFR